MGTYAQIVGGRAYNVIVGTDVAAAKAKHFVAGFDGGYPGVDWTSVPDGTKSGATDAGGGVFNNPPPVLVPKPLRPDEVLDLMPAAVVKSIRDSTSASVIKRYEAFKMKPNWTKEEGDVLFGDMVTATLMTAQQKIDALAAWPTTGA